MLPRGTIQSDTSQKATIKRNNNNQTDFANKANNAATNLNRLPL